ncbi:uncharacterized protein zgc:174877 isoform X7 [Myxocyprinus asiaticus]|uniref:uncharacterized protein zgc:174877 isoform X6 n=1 Tax=Myxocyprinus asiaticus TaxID=70543 RepID=UPI00222366FF|nr:uncharacterized protein zgc:174877 isoform X6 [Myxocyprinus asiaticus]XP_051542801.1 uncharacterized protein zgc:174877 isoform X7 [Myxocyprinus asiaticus]
MNTMFDLKCESDEEEMEAGEPVLTAQISRCANISSADLEELENFRCEANTIRQTVWAINCFKTWLSEKEITIDLKTVEKSELCPVLREFYGSIRTSKGELYGVSSYLALRGGLNRFINEPPLSRAWNLMQDTEFMSANNVFKGVVKQIRRSGRGKTTHFPPISPEDQHILKHSPALDPGNPKGLLNKVWYDIQLYFGHRGKEGNRHLQPDSFALNRDLNGLKYFTMTLNEETNNPYEKSRKNRRGVNMIEEPGNPLCPVASLEKYLRKIPPDAKAFYLQPRKRYLVTDDIWYTAVPLGVNLLSQMLPKICKKAGTRSIYTNHSMRVTAIQRQDSKSDPVLQTTGILLLSWNSVQVGVSPQCQQESAPSKPSSEMDSSSTRQDTCETPVNSYSWMKQEADTEAIKCENTNSVAASDAEQDNTQSSAISSNIPNEGEPSSMMQTITRLQCLLESKKERIEALEKQVQDLQEDRKFLRTQIENLTSARVVHVPEASTSLLSESRPHKRQRKSSSSTCDTEESVSDESVSTASSESSSNKKKRRHKNKKQKKGRRGRVSQHGWC